MNYADNLRMNVECLKANAHRAAALLQAIGNEKRLLILCLLAEQERCVSELAGLVELSQSALSQHLARLRTARLVKTRRCGLHIFYSLSQGDALALMQALSDLCCTHARVNEPAPDR